MEIEFKEYQPRKIVNIHKHVDGPWFWDKYSAHPYIGCRHGCEFCYARGGSYLGRRSPATFDRMIQVKTNAPKLLHKELSRLQPDLIVCGDWQRPAEERYQLSRQMLGVILECGFPLLVIERSPYVVRDLDLLQQIHRRSWAGVTFSISTLDPTIQRVLEPHTPHASKRLQAMQSLARAGISVGTTLMPILPILADDRAYLEEVIRATREHGGSFVIAGGLSMEGAQAQRTLNAYARVRPEAAEKLQRLVSSSVPSPTAADPSRSYNSRLGLMVRELCGRYGLRDRMPRPILPGKLAANKRIAEKLFLKTYDLELEGAEPSHIWTYRKAAWTVDEWPERLPSMVQARGESALRELPGIGNRLSALIMKWMEEEKFSPG